MPLIQANDMGDEYMKIGFIKNKYMDSSFWSMIQYEPIFAQVEKVVCFVCLGSGILQALETFRQVVELGENVINFTQE